MFLRLCLLLLPLLTTACDPCSALGSCGAPQVRYEGRLEKAFGPAAGPAGDVRVKFVRTGGVELESDTVGARSGPDGRFLLEARAEAEGQVVGDLWIYPPEPVEPVRVEGVRMATSRAPGEVRTLGEWKVAFPYFAYQASVYYRATREPARGVEVEFRRTGGIPVHPDTFRVTTNQWGEATLRPRTEVYGEVVGELVVHPLPPYAPFTVRDVRLRTFVTERVDSLIRIGIGSGLPYAVHVFWEEDRTPAEGVELEFRRTSGVPITPERFTSRSDRYGTAWLNPTPLAPGEVVGDVTLRPPPPGETVVLRGVRLPTVEDDRVPGILYAWGIPAADSATVTP